MIISKQSHKQKIQKSLYANTFFPCFLLLREPCFPFSAKCYSSTANSLQRSKSVYLRGRGIILSAIGFGLGAIFKATHSTDFAGIHHNGPAPRKRKKKSLSLKGFDNSQNFYGTYSVFCHRVLIYQNIREYYDGKSDVTYFWHFCTSCMI